MKEFYLLQTCPNIEKLLLLHLVLMVILILYKDLMIILKENVLILSKFLIIKMLN